MYLNIFLEKNKVLNKFKYLEVGRVIFFNLTLQTFWSNLNLKIPWIFLNELILIRANVRVEKCISTVQFQDKSDLGRLSLSVGSN
jgi:hypothetical protein